MSVENKIVSRLKEFTSRVKAVGRIVELEEGIRAKDEQVKALEAKANAFDALEGLVKGNKEVVIDFGGGDYCVTTDRIYGGPDLQSAINDAVHGGGGE